MQEPWNDPGQLRECKHISPTKDTGDYTCLSGHTSFAEAIGQLFVSGKWSFRLCVCVWCISNCAVPWRFRVLFAPRNKIFSCSTNLRLSSKSRGPIHLFSNEILKHGQCGSNEVQTLSFLHSTWYRWSFDKTTSRWIVARVRREEGAERPRWCLVTSNRLKQCTTKLVSITVRSRRNMDHKYEGKLFPFCDWSWNSKSFRANHVRLLPLFQENAVRDATGLPFPKFFWSF